MNFSRKKGDRFERRVKQFFEDNNCFVIRQSASTFPDLIVFPFKESHINSPVLLIECKVNKYISKEEKQKFDRFLSLRQEVIRLIAYNEKRKLKFCDLEYKIYKLDTEL